MPIYLNESLRKENISAVFCAVADHGCDTRSDISAHTGISVVTVGKAAEGFLDSGIFIQKESQKKTVGRHASRILLDRSKHLVIIDITSNNFEVSYFNLALERVYNYVHEYIDDFCYTDNLCAFLHRVKAHMLECKDNRYLATCMIVPGNYDKESDKVVNCDSPELSKIRLQDHIRTKVGMSVNRIIDRTVAAVRHCQKLCIAGDNVLYLRLDSNETLQSRIIVDGKVLKNLSGCGRTVSGDDVRLFVADFIADICAVANIAQVYIEGNNRLYDEDANQIKTLLSDGRLLRDDRVPVVLVNSGIPFSHLGSASYLRSIWLDNFMR
ncbi:MAG: hypothetical protein IJY27_05725 [Clostridia bacterium]|nr:hypothetical protein [Clostridia bacterium]